MTNAVTRGGTVLHYTAKSGQLAVCEWLLAKINLKTIHATNNIRTPRLPL